MKGESSSSFFRLFPPIVYALLCTTASIAASAVVPINPFLGIPPQDENYYKASSPTIKCKDGSATFTKAHLNDDFCDCPDGTDEPGTSACPGGQFYCRNAGHDPVFLFSSRVNDGICDCCDGSDEYDGEVKCPNTCWEAGKVARDKLKKKIATYKEGVALRKKEVEQAKMAFAKDVAELSKLKNEEKILKGLVEQLKELKEQIEKTEEKERLQKEKEEKQRKEAEEKANGEKSAVKGGANLEKGHAEEKIDNEDKDMENKHDEIGVLDDSPAYQDVVDEFADHGAEDESGDVSKIEGSPVSEVEKHEGQEDEEPVTTKIKDESTLVPETGHDAGNEVSHAQPMEEEKDESTDAKGLSKEELGRLVGSRWTGNSEKQTEEVRDTKDNDHGDHEEMAHDTHDEKYDGYASETADETGKDDDVDGEDDVDETYEEEVHDDVDDAPYKSDSDDEVEFSDTTSPGNPSWLENIQQTFRSILEAFKLFQTPVDKSEAARVRKEYDESSAKLSKIQSRISRLTQKLEHDFGTEKEFYSFYDRCFESKQNKFTTLLLLVYIPFLFQL
ncbi:hypothetical protein POPTR_001G001700v4 [Populus trichocarpa]|uniref:Uncharacterized protein n=1 Tax=Populus trichocarpa TaxID=3694 RepID=A0ACC0TG91_POPTR|nr:hypothetical protein POPTR_001G001700v4 [Populus trichocarpa]